MSLRGRFSVLLALVLASSVVIDAGAASKRKARTEGERRAKRAADRDESDPPPKKRLLVDRRGAAEKDDDAAKEAKSDPPVRYAKLPGMDVHARDLRLTEAGKSRLVRIAERFHEATGKRLVVTGGWRSRRRQAQLMIQKLEHGDDMVGLYENKEAAKEIEEAFRRAKADRKKKKEILDAVEHVVAAQVAKGVVVSRHLVSGAVDVKSLGMKPEHVDALVAAVGKETEVALLDEREAAEPHFHLSLPGE